MTNGGAGGTLEGRPGRGLSPPRTPERRSCTRYEPSAKDLELLGLVGVPVVTPPRMRPSSASSFFGPRLMHHGLDDQSRAAITAEVRSASAALLASLEKQVGPRQGDARTPSWGHGGVADAAEYFDVALAVQPPAILSGRRRPASAPFPVSRRGPRSGNHANIWGNQLPANTMICGKHVGIEASAAEAGVQPRAEVRAPVLRTALLEPGVGVQRPLSAAVSSTALPSAPIRALPHRAPLPSESGELSQMDTWVASSEAGTSAQISAQPSAQPSAHSTARRVLSGQLAEQPVDLSSEELEAQISGQVCGRRPDQPGDVAPFTGNFRSKLPEVRVSKGRCRGPASRYSLPQGRQEGGRATNPRQSSLNMLTRPRSAGSLVAHSKVEASGSDASISWLSHPHTGAKGGASATLEYTGTMLSAQDSASSLSLVGQKMSNPYANLHPSGAFRQPNFKTVGNTDMTEEAAILAQHVLAHEESKSLLADMFHQQRKQEWHWNDHWKRLPTGGPEKSPAAIHDRSEDKLASFRSEEIANGALLESLGSPAKEVLTPEDEGFKLEWLAEAITPTFRAPPPTRVLNSGTASAAMPPTRLSSGPGRQIGSNALPYSLRAPPIRPPTGLQSVEDVIEHRRREGMTRIAACPPSMPRSGSGTLATLANGLQKAEEQRLLMAS